MITLFRKPTILLMIVVVMGLSIGLALEKRSSSLFKIPIVVEDLDQSNSSVQWIKTIDKSPNITLTTVNEGFLTAEELVKSNQATLVFVIPEGFEDNLAKQKTKKTITSYQSEGIVAAVAMESISQTLYEQQIPLIIKKYVDDKWTSEEIKEKFNANEPNMKLQKNASQQSGNAGTIQHMLLVVLLYFLLMSQVILFNRLRQFKTMKRMKLYKGAVWKMYSQFVAVILLAAMTSAVIAGAIWQIPIDIIHIFVWITPFQIILTVAFFKVTTTSHLLFITFLWSICYSLFYSISQLMGGVI